MSNHADFYSFAEYYDIAFDFKDVSLECDFLTSCFEALTGASVSSFLELAAGPALHAIEFGCRGVSSVAMDVSMEMVEYGLLKAKKSNVPLDYFCGDMIDFQFDKTFDLIAILMDSTSYLLDNDSVISHLNAVARHLNPNGLYILEMSHPRDIFNMGESTDTSWEMERDGKKVAIQWGSPSDVFDPITQITQTTVKMEVFDQGKKRELIESAPQRCFSANEFAALVRGSGQFKLAEVFGAMERSVAFSNDKAAWRMVSVLQKL